MTKVPKSFTLGPYRIAVKVLPEDKLNERAGLAVYGLWVPGELTIYLRAPSETHREELFLGTFWHEYFHALYWTLGRTDECNDEVLVDQCGALTMQALQTAKF